MASCSDISAARSSGCFASPLHDDSFSASATPVGGELFLRGERYLYCIAEGQ